MRGKREKEGSLPFVDFPGIAHPFADDLPGRLLTTEIESAAFPSEYRIMQYVRNISDSVSTAWNSINPSTLSGAIDVIVVEQEDGSLACSPFHVRFGKFSLLRPYEKKVEFKVGRG